MNSNYTYIKEDFVQLKKGLEHLNLLSWYQKKDVSWALLNQVFSADLSSNRPRRTLSKNQRRQYNLVGLLLARRWCGGRTMTKSWKGLDQRSAHRLRDPETKHQSFHCEAISWLFQGSSKEESRIATSEGESLSIPQPTQNRKSWQFPRLTHVYKLQE